MKHRFKKAAGLAASAVALMMTAQAAQAEVLDSSTEGFTLEFSFAVDGQLKSVFEGLSNDIGKWWLADHTWYGKSSNMSLELKPGGCLCEIEDQHRFTEHLRVVKVEPYSLIRFSGGLGPLQGEGVQGIMDWKLVNSPDEQTTTVTVRYRVGGYTGNDLSRWAPAVDNVSQQQMNSFQSYMNQ